MRLLKLLRTALRIERKRGIAGHWTYDVGRHARLLQAYRIERAEVRIIISAASPPENRGSLNAKQPERDAPAASK